MPKNLLLSINACADRDVTRYACWGGRCFLNIDGDLGRSVVGASGLKLGLSGRGGHQSRRDLRMVKDGSGMEGSLRRRITLGRSDVGETPG